MGFPRGAVLRLFFLHLIVVNAAFSKPKCSLALETYPMKVKGLSLKDKSQEVYNSIKDLEEEYLALIDEGLIEDAAALLDDSYPELELKALSLLEESGLKFKRVDTKYVLLPDSAGVYGRVAHQLLRKEGYLFYINFRSNIENSFQAHVNHSERGISLPIEILLDPMHLNFSMYHELRHVYYEGNRDSNKNPLKSKVYILAPGRGELRFKNSRIVYNQGFSIEELMTFYNDRRMFDSQLAKDNPSFLGLTQEDRKTLLGDIAAVHSELMVYTLMFLRRIDEALLGVGEPSFFIRFNPQNNLSLVKKNTDGTTESVARLSLSEEYFGSLKTKEGRKNLKDWVRAAIKEIELMRDKMPISLTH